MVASSILRMGSNIIPVKSFLLYSITTSWILSSNSPTASAATMTAEVCRPTSYSEQSPSVSSRSAMLCALACFSRRAAFTHLGAPLPLNLSNTLTWSSSLLSTMAAYARLRLRSDSFPLSLAFNSRSLSCSALLASAARLISGFGSAFAALLFAAQLG